MQDNNQEKSADFEGMLTKEIQDAFYELRQDIEQLAKVVKLYQETAEVRNELQDTQIKQTKEVWESHIIACEAQKKELTDLVDAVTAIRSGMKITNFLRNSIVWLAGGATAIYSLYQLAKEVFK
jgi:hypothetical protein